MGCRITRQDRLTVERLSDRGGTTLLVRTGTSGVRILMMEAYGTTLARVVEWTFPHPNNTFHVIQTRESIAMRIPLRATDQAMKPPLCLLQDILGLKIDP